MADVERLPPIEVVLSELADIAGTHGLTGDIRLDALADHDVESLDLLEWLYELADRYDLPVDETIFAGLEEPATLGSVYDRCASGAMSVATRTRDAST